MKFTHDISSFAAGYVHGCEDETRRIVKKLRELHAEHADNRDAHMADEAACETLEYLIAELEDTEGGEHE